jgi:hypothetical protein
MVNQESATRMCDSEYTSLHVHTDVHERLKSLKPYESMSFNDLLVDMADEYDSNRGTETN